MGPIEEQLIKQARAAHRDLPARIQKAPEMFAGYAFYYQAFWALNSCRPVGWGEGSIPWTAVYAFAQAHRLPEEELDFLWFLIERLDSEYTRYQRAKAEAARGVSGGARHH